MSSMGTKGTPRKTLREQPSSTHWAAGSECRDEQHLTRVCREPTRQGGPISTSSVVRWGWVSPGALPVPCQRAGGAGRGSRDGHGAAGDGAEGAALNGSLVGKPLPSAPGVAEQRAHLSRLRGCGQKRDCGRLGDRGETPRGVLGESRDGVPTGGPARGRRGWPTPGDSPPRVATTSHCAK